MVKGIERNFQKDLEPDVYRESLAAVGAVLGELANNLADVPKGALAGQQKWIKSDARLTRWDIYKTSGYQALKQVLEDKGLTLMVHPFAHGDDDVVRVLVTDSRD